MGKSKKDGKILFHVSSENFSKFVAKPVVDLSYHRLLCDKGCFFSEKRSDIVTEWTWVARSKFHSDDDKLPSKKTSRFVYIYEVVIPHRIYKEIKKKLKKIYDSNSDYALALQEFLIPEEYVDCIRIIKKHKIDCSRLPQNGYGFKSEVLDRFLRGRKKSKKVKRRNRNNLFQNGTG